MLTQCETFTWPHFIALKQKKHGFESFGFFFNRTFHNEEYFFFILVTLFPRFGTLNLTFFSSFVCSFHNHNIYWFITSIGSVYFLSPFLRQFCSDLWFPFFCSHCCCCYFCSRYRLSSIFFLSHKSNCDHCTFHLNHLTICYITVQVVKLKCVKELLCKIQ